MEKQTGFALILVKIMQASTNNVAQQAAAIAFKNHIKAYWTKVRAATDADGLRAAVGRAHTARPGVLGATTNQHEDKPDPLGDESRETVRRHIVDLMLQAPAAVQRQVGEAVTIIADHDFPQRWDYLLQVCAAPAEPPVCQSARLRVSACSDGAGCCTSAGLAQAHGPAGQRGARARDPHDGALHLQAVRWRPRPPTPPARPARLTWSVPPSAIGWRTTRSRWCASCCLCSSSLQRRCCRSCRFVARPTSDPSSHALIPP